MFCKKKSFWHRFTCNKDRSQKVSHLSWEENFVAIITACNAIAFSKSHWIYSAFGFNWLFLVLFGRTCWSWPGFALGPRLSFRCRCWGSRGWISRFLRGRSSFLSFFGCWGRLRFFLDIRIRIWFIWFFLHFKGKLISECLLGVIDFPKKQRKIWQISALESKKWSNQQIKSAFL